MLVVTVKVVVVIAAGRSHVGGHLNTFSTTKINDKNSHILSIFSTVSSGTFKQIFAPLAVANIFLKN